MNKEPAFPQIYWDKEGQQYLHGEGMSMRDYFAAKAMQQLIAMHDENYFQDLIDGTRGALKVSQASYVVADAMLEARK